MIYQYSVEFYNNIYNFEMKTKKNSINDAVKSQVDHKHQDLSKENLGIEPEEQPKGNSEFKMEGFDDKRPEDPSIEKGWTPDSNTSRDSSDL